MPATSRMAGAARPGEGAGSQGGQESVVIHDKQGAKEMIEHVPTKAAGEPTTVTPLYTAVEWQLLRALRELYERDRDLLLSEERARLSFIRWLVRTGQLTP